MHRRLRMWLIGDSLDCGQQLGGRRFRWSCCHDATNLFFRIVASIDDYWYVRLSVNWVDRQTLFPRRKGVPQLPRDICLLYYLDLSERCFAKFGKGTSSPKETEKLSEQGAKD
ncbi:hypothetical protein BS47DRAFT_1403367 [Hydnum rufescens UP504]|uniref:Uncharacterized protein n=1 Tax=Hydnum rufescens UP504 TaxID=1448309 RepID=A0A9P6AA19_9AGAM|nr:hypothetical protein BS47DRAFT_1403367 [Hydnum rufescens UP504]